MDDTSLSAAASIVGLVVAFSFGYFVAIFPFAEDLAGVDAPDDEAKRRRLYAKLRAVYLIFAAIAGGAILTALLLVPGVVDILTSFDLTRPYSIARAAFLALEAGLVILVVASAIEVKRIRTRAQEVLDFRPGQSRPTLREQLAKAKSRPRTP